MSGRKQHFIPQSLLRGFGRKGKGKKVMVVAYTYDRGIFIRATDGVGAERDFYSELSVAGGEPTLDDRITGYETSLADKLKAMCVLPNNGNVENLAAAEFVTHLVVRNDYFRKAVSSAGADLLDGFSKVIAEEHVAKAFLGLDGETASAMFAQEIAQAYLQYNGLFKQAGIDEKQFSALVFGFAKDNFSELHSKLIAPVAESLRNATPQIADIAADAQRRALNEKGLSPKARVEWLAEFHWVVVHVDVDLILPDCVAIAISEDGIGSPLMLADSDKVASVFMPLASRRILMGTRGSVVLDIAWLNETMASCSWDFFVAVERTPAFEALRDSLRSRSASLLDDAVAAVLLESVCGRLDD